MKLEKLFKELTNNPNKIQEIEVEINRLINAPDLSETAVLYQSNTPEMKLYALKVVEERIKLKKSNNVSLVQEIEFMKGVIISIGSIYPNTVPSSDRTYPNTVPSSDRTYPNTVLSSNSSNTLTYSNKAADAFAVLGLYEWPNFFPDFFQIIIDLLASKKEIGYKILHEFLYKLNYSQDINDKRKNELKKAIGMVYKGFMQLFDDEMVNFIIPILTESIRILPKDFDYSIVFRKGFECPEKTVEFINEMGNSLPLQDVIELSTKMPVMIGMVIYFNNIKNRSSDVVNLPNLYEYVFKALRYDLSTFTVSIEFWTKLFGKKNKEVYANLVLGEVISIFMNLEDDQKSEVEGEVYGLFNVLIKNYPNEVYGLLKTGLKFMPKRLQLFFIRKLNESQVPTGLLAQLSSDDPIVTSTIMVLDKNPEVIGMIDFLDLLDKDSSKLIIRIMQVFPLSKEKINEIIDRCIKSMDSKAIKAIKSNHTNTKNNTYNNNTNNNTTNLPSCSREPVNELLVECFLKLDKIESFEGGWDHNKLMRLFYYLRKAPMKVSYLSTRYYQEFLLKAPFDRCFSILRMFGDVPRDIYENIYANALVYSYPDLNCFLRDLLPFLNVQEPYIARITERIIKDWTVLEDPEDLIICTKTLLSVMSEGIQQANEKNTPYHSINSLLDLLQLDDTGLIRRVSDIFCLNKGSYDMKKALYYLLVNYNSSFVEGAHLNVSATITKCIKEENGPVALHEILGIPMDKCVNLNNEIGKVQTKRAQNIVRVFLKDFKGTPLNSIYSETFKVGEQGFIKKDTKRSDFEFPIERTFFE